MLADDIDVERFGQLADQGCPARECERPRDAAVLEARGQAAGSALDGELGPRKLRNRAAELPQDARLFLARQPQALGLAALGIDPRVEEDAARQDLLAVIGIVRLGLGHDTRFKRKFGRRPRIRPGIARLRGQGIALAVDSLGQRDTSSILIRNSLGHDIGREGLIDQIPIRVASQEHVDLVVGAARVRRPDEAVHLALVAVPDP